VLYHRDYSLVIVDSQEQIEKEARCTSLLYQQRVDAVVMSMVDSQSKIYQQFFDSGTPVVFIDNLPYIDEPFDAVVNDDRKASRLAVEHLALRGHSRIAMIAGIPENRAGKNRLEGFREAMQEAGLEYDEDLVAFGDYREESGAICMERLLQLRKKKPFTAIYITSERMTFGAVKTLRRYSVQIPSDLAVIGCDVHDPSGLMMPGITTVRQQERAIGNMVGKILINRLRREEDPEEETLPQRTHYMEPYIEIKESG